jgi:lipopolysaccharide/colanic/teichoic acid biosynthesis glycosyltransferase
MKKVRSIDVVGWLDNDRIGVILPATKIEGARQFASRVSDSIQTATALLPAKVYSYPENWYQQDKEQLDNQPVMKDGSVEQHATEIPEVVKSVFCLREPFWKRAMDIAGSLGGLIVLFPVLSMLVIYIKLVSPGPILFKQKRVGKNAKIFTFLKFRSMKHETDENFHKNHIVASIRANQPLAKLDDMGDSRIIPGGKILRKTCLDELPQLINVLRGDMSLVGPRPCMPYEAEEFRRWHTHRFDVMPGLTGLWQVSGKNKLTFSQMIRLDISYAEHMTFFWDMKIIAHTIPAIIKMVLESVMKRWRIEDRKDKPAPIEGENTVAT